MKSPNEVVTDNISRLLGVAALIVAVAGGYYLWQQNQQLEKQLTELPPTPGDAEAYQAFVKTWDEKLSGALTEFGKQADAATKEFDAAREARNRIFDAANKQVAGLSQEDVEGLIADKVVGLVADSITKEMGQLKLPQPEPELRLATTVLRPREDGALPIPSVRNVGAATAEIVAVRFQPRKGSEFVVKRLPMVAEEGQLVVEFGPEHNQGATMEGAHRFYERSYVVLGGQEIASNETVKVSIEIRANNRHLDWGMMGDLELEYQDGRTVLIPNACAVFVPDPDKTT